jgi:RNA polymerase sigma-70 factor (ECF subfamily)
MMTDDADIVTRLKAGEPDAADELVNAYGMRLLRSAILLCGNEADAQDIVQETLITAVKAIQRFRGRSALYTWLHGILINTSRHALRKRRPTVALDDVAEPAAPDNPVLQADCNSRSAVLLEFLDTLSAEHREVLVMRYFDDMKINDIATALGVRTGTVKSRLHYALAALRDTLPREMNLSALAGHA